MDVNDEFKMARSKLEEAVMKALRIACASQGTGTLDVKEEHTSSFQEYYNNLCTELTEQDKTFWSSWSNVDVNKLEVAVLSNVQGGNCNYGGKCGQVWCEMPLCVHWRVEERGLGPQAMPVPDADIKDRLEAVKTININIEKVVSSLNRVVRHRSQIFNRMLEARNYEGNVVMEPLKFDHNCKFSLPYLHLCSLNAMHRLLPSSQQVKRARGERERKQQNDEPDGNEVHDTSCTRIFVSIQLLSLQQDKIANERG
jgi:hypothetical protein